MTGSSSTSWITHRHWIVLFLIILATFSVYANSFQTPFEFDDHRHIAENNEIRDPANFLGLGDMLHRRTLVKLTFALNYWAHGLDVFGYHLVNIAIHAINGCLVYFLTLTILAAAGQSYSAGPRPGGRERLMALFSALVFVTHPLQTQAVTYIVQRMTSMAALFYLAAVLLYLRGRMAMIAGCRSRRRNAYLYFSLAALSGILAVLCKQNAATLPGVVMVMEYLLFDRTMKGWMKKLPWLAAGVVLWGLLLLVTVGFFAAAGSDGTPVDLSSITRMTDQKISRWNYLCTQFNAVAIYIRLLVLPVRQNLDYMYPVKTGFFDGLTPVAFLFLAAVLAGGIRAVKKQPVTSLAVLWFFITLMVESSVIPIDDTLVEHRLYLPIFGFALLLPHLFFSRLSHRPAVVTTCCILIVILLSAGTVARNMVWSDEIIMWKDVIEKSPSNARAYNNLGWALTRQERYEEAVPVFTKSLKFDPDYAEAMSNLAFVFKSLDRLDEAEAVSLRALQLKPDYAKAHINLANIYMKQDRFQEAVRHFGRGLPTLPRDQDAHNNMGLALVSLDKIDEGISYYHQALALAPEDAEVLTNLGLALKKQGKTNQATEHFTQALRNDPGCAEAHNHLGTVMAGNGALEQAVIRYREAVRLDPDYADAHNNLGLTLTQRGDLEQALDSFHQAISLNPGLAEAHNNLGGTLAKLGKAKEAVPYIEKALRLKTGFASAHNNMGNTMFLLDRFEEAVFHYSEALKVNPNLEAARTNMAIVRKIVEKHAVPDTNPVKLDQGSTNPASSESE